MCLEITPVFKSSFGWLSLRGFLVGLWHFIIILYLIKKNDTIMTHRTSFSVSKFMLITYFQVLFKISFSNEQGSDQFQTRYVSSLLSTK